MKILMLLKAKKLLLKKKTKYKLGLFSYNNSLTWMWNLGFSCGISLFIQMVSGILLSFRYETNEANIIMEEMESIYEGWMWSSIHSMGSTMYFMFMYMHMYSSMISSCNIYSPWLTGCILYIMSFLTALVGYSLTKGNMAQWALTVVTSLVMNFPKGNMMFKMIMGDNGISEKIIPSMYSIHFMLGMSIPLFVILHISEIHKKEFSSDLNMSNSMLNKEFIGSGMMKDIFMMPIMFLSLNQGLKENSFMWKLIKDVNSNDWPQLDKTPEPIGPEWYVLFLFSTLKMTNMKFIMIGSSMVLLSFSSKYNKITIPLIMLGKMVILGYLALNAHLSIEDPIMMSKILLMNCYLLIFK